MNNQTISAGQVYYIPEQHRLVSIRELEDHTVLCGRPCKFLNDSKTTRSTTSFTKAQLNEFVLVEDPAKMPQLEEHWTGTWSVVYEKYVHQDLVQERLSQISNLLGRQSGVHNVHLFGSVALNGTGNDFDIIATVSETVFRSWKLGLLDSLYNVGFDADGFDLLGDALAGPRNPDVYFNATLRLQEAVKALSVSEKDYATLEGLQFFENTTGSKGFPKKNQYMKVDIFLFPDNWDMRINELQLALPHTDPFFMQNVLTDAKLI